MKQEQNETGKWEKKINEKENKQDLENPQRFIAEGLGAPEFEIIKTPPTSEGEVNAQSRAGCVHCLPARK